MQTGIKWEITGPDGTRAVLNDPTDPDHCGYTAAEDGVTGLGEAGVREDAEESSDADGGWHGDFFRDRMPFVITGFLDPNVDFTTVNQMESRLKRACRALRADGTVVWTPDGDVERMASFRLQQQSYKFTGSWPKKFQIPLVSATHRVLSSAENSQTFAAGGTGGEIGFDFPLDFPLTFAIGSSGAATIANIGDEDSPPRFRIDGPITNPTIRNATTGEEIRLLTSIAAGDFITVDGENAEVLLNGVSDVYSVVQFPGSKWWTLPAASSSDVRLLATAFSAPAALTVFWRHAWS